MSMMQNSKFRKFFQDRLRKQAQSNPARSMPSATGRSRNPVGSDYNRAQQAVNASMGRMNVAGTGGGRNVSDVESMQKKTMAAQRNRSAEQGMSRSTAPAKPQRPSSGASQGKRTDMEQMRKRLFGG